VQRGLEDFSISRQKTKMPWGVEVPGDPDHVMYVWFDALVNYISTLGWPEDTVSFEKFWKDGTPVQYCGKDNLRQQTAMWQAMLMATGLPHTHTVVVEGFINSDGKKMSKSIGNVVSPMEIIAQYGTDALRYHVAREFSTFEDSDFTWDKFKESYNANLANGLPLEESVQRAKQFVHGAIMHAPGIGGGHGPLMHRWQSLSTRHD